MFVIIIAILCLLQPLQYHVKLDCQTMLFLSLAFGGVFSERKHFVLAQDLA